MFRNDKLTVKRVNYEKVEGEAIYNNPAVIIHNAPCHLSVSLNNTIGDGGFPYLISSYTLFLDYSPEFAVIKENDILLVITSKNQKYKLKAGEIKIYDRTIQIRCSQEKIIESTKNDN